MGTIPSERDRNIKVREHNKESWDKKVADGDRWTRPVSSDAIERARHGQFDLLLTPTKSVPRNWFPQLSGTDVLCLASGGGQQAPMLAAAGAKVTVLDNSQRQLAQDRFVAEREHLSIETIEGDMADLSCFGDGSFQLIVHPCSNCYVPDVRPVWRECFRVLGRGGTLLSGFANPVRYLFDDEQMEKGSLQVRHPIPYSDLASLSEPKEHKVLETQRPLEFGHTLADQIGGQLDAGFLIGGFFEDRFAPADQDSLSDYLDTFIATRAVKP